MIVSKHFYLKYYYVLIYKVRFDDFNLIACLTISLILDDYYKKNL